MARVILHMGTHKTATTTLQDSFHMNRERLAEQGVIYPAIGRHTGHHGLLTDWIALPEAYWLPEGGTCTLKALAARYVDTDKTFLLSSEEFSRGGGQGGQVDMAAIRAIFQEYDEITVVFCIRPQWQFLQSVYLEISRDRRPPSPVELVANVIATGQVDGLWCDYGALHTHLCRSFEPEQIRLMDFDVARQHPEGVIGAFLDIIDTSVCAGDLEPLDKHSNVSPRPLPVWAGQAMLPEGVAAAGPKGADLLEVLGRVFDLEYGANRPGSIFTRAELGQLNAHFKPLNAALQAKICIYQPEFVLTNKLPEAETIYREDVGAALWVRAARRIFMDMAGPSTKAAP